MDTFVACANCPYRDLKEPTEDEADSFFECWLSKRECHMNLYEEEYSWCQVYQNATRYIYED
jgi:hypothetical protein